MNGWWKRYEVDVDGRVFRFTDRRTALWALNLARPLVSSAGRDRWTGKAL